MHRGRWPQVALALAGVAQLVMWGTQGTTATVESSTVDRGAAAGDAYAVLAHGLGGSFNPGAPSVGPMAPVDAQAPPAGATSRQSGTMVCDSSGPGTCPGSVLHSLRVTEDSVVATLHAGSRGCSVPGSPGRPLAPPAATACDAVAHTEVALGPAAIVADGVTSRSTSQGCAPPVGTASLGSLRVLGVPITGGTAPGGLLPGLRTMVLPPGSSGAAVLATVVLDEQIVDPGGGGLTVNAVHVHGGPALGALAGLDVVIGHTHTRSTCPRLELVRETIPTGEVTYVVVDPSVFPLDAGVVGGGSAACFAGARRGNGCMEPIAAMVARRHAILGVTSNYTDWIHVLGATIVDHDMLIGNNPHTTGLCIGDGADPNVPVVTVRTIVDPEACRAAVAGQLVVSGGRRDIYGLSDAGHHDRFWWSTRPGTAEPRSMVAVRADGTVLIALATATRGGVLGGITQPDMVGWLIAHGAVDAIEMDGGDQGDMVVAGGAHVVPLGDGVPKLQVSLLLDDPGSIPGDVTR